MKLISFLSVCFFMFGCATTPTNLVRQPIGDQQAIVQLGTPAIKAGDRVELFKETCREVTRKDFTTTRCSKASRGMASVLELKSSQEAIIKADSGVALEQGLFVEKANQ
jgi:hypothetical protein